MTHLLDRLRAATEPSRELWGEAFDLCLPYMGEREINGYRTGQYLEWRARQRRFLNLIAIEAWLDAALMLVPEGMWWTLAAGRTREDEPLYGAQILRPDISACDAVGEAETDAHPAIALAIAALEARNTGATS